MLSKILHIIRPRTAWWIIPAIVVGLWAWSLVAHAVWEAIG